MEKLPPENKCLKKVEVDSKCHKTITRPLVAGDGKKGGGGGRRRRIALQDMHIAKEKER